MTKTKEAKTSTSFDPQLLGADASSAVEAITAAGEKGAELVDAWVAAKNAAAVAAVAGDEKAPGAARKAARRGLSVLKARGVSIPERSHVARLGGDPVEGYEAWFVAPDGSGTAAVLVAERRASGRHRLVHTVVREGMGLIEAKGADVSRTQLRASFDHSIRQFGYGPTPVPVAWARARVAAARTENAKSGALLPIGVDSHDDVLLPLPDGAEAHPVDAAALELSDPRVAVADSAVLHGEPEFSPWLPNGPAVQQLMLEIGQRIGADGGAGAEASIEERAKRTDTAISDAIDASTDRFFTPEVRERLAERMKDSAISVLARAGRQRAALVVATAAAARAAGLITSPPHEIPFLRGFFQKALAVLASQSEGRLNIPVPVDPGAAPAPLPDAPAPEAAPPAPEAAPPAPAP